MHRFLLVVESKRIVRAAEMHLADCVDQISGTPDMLCSTLAFPVIGMDVVLASGFVDMTPSREQRNPNWTFGIGITAPSHPTGKTILCGRRN